MKNLIENCRKNWIEGLRYLIVDKHISFYTFFTVILAECSYLWAFYEFAVAVPITVILLGYMLNVIVFARLKGNTEGTKLEKVFSILYVGVFVTLFVIGCFFNWALSIITTAIILGVTALWIVIRNYQTPFYYLPEDLPKIARLINEVFSNKIFWILSQIIIIGGPFIVLVIFFFKIPFIPIVIKVIIPLLYLIFSPLIAHFEDDSAACNIFELAYDVTWSKEYEEYCKRFKKMEEEINNKNVT